MNMQSDLARFGSKITFRRRHVSLWPWPSIVWGDDQPLFTEDDYQFFMKVIKPGDFILARQKPYWLTNKMIRGSAFKHLAVFTGPVHGLKNRETGFISKPTSLGIGKYDDEDTSGTRFKATVTHAIAEGVVTQDLFRLLRHIDYACIVRPWKTVEEQCVIVETALSQVGLEYNFDFSPAGPPASYCTELGAYCMNKIHLPSPDYNNIMVKWWGKKGPVLLADSFCHNLNMVACSVSCDDPDFYRNSIIGDSMRRYINICPCAEI